MTVRTDDGGDPTVATAARIGRASWAASTTRHSASPPTTQTLLSTSHSPPSNLNFPDVTTRATGPRPARWGSGVPRVFAVSRSTTTEADFAAVHLGERLFDVVEADRLGDERVEVEAPLAVEVDEHREVPRGKAVAVPADFNAPPRPKTSINGSLMRMSGSVRRRGPPCRRGRGRRTPARRSRAGPLPR